MPLDQWHTQPLGSCRRWGRCGPQWLAASTPESLLKQLWFFLLAKLENLNIFYRWWNGSVSQGASCAEHTNVFPNTSHGCKESPPLMHVLHFLQEHVEWKENSPLIHISHFLYQNYNQNKSRGTNRNSWRGDKYFLCLGSCSPSVSQLMDRAGCPASAFLPRQWKEAKAQGSWTVGIALYKYVHSCVCVYVCIYIRFSCACVCSMLVCACARGGLRPNMTRVILYCSSTLSIEGGSLRESQTCQFGKSC